MLIGYGYKEMNIELNDKLIEVAVNEVLKAQISNLLSSRLNYEVREEVEKSFRLALKNHKAILDAELNNALAEAIKSIDLVKGFKTHIIGAINRVTEAAIEKKLNHIIKEVKIG